MKLLLDSYDEIPFDALTYLIAECNYGGRVTDFHDRRLIKSLLNNFLNINLISNPEFNFSSQENQFYKIPTDNLSFDGYISYIRQMPLITHPEVFGLHANATIVRDNTEIQQIFESILLTLPREVSLYLLKSKTIKRR